MKEQLFIIRDACASLAPSDLEKFQRWMSFAVRARERNPRLAFGIYESGVAVLYNDVVWRVMGGSPDSPTLIVAKEIGRGDVWWL